MNIRKECTLLQRTRALLQQQSGSYLDIYIDIGLAPNWLSLFANGKIKDPSVNKVQALYEYLNKKPLNLN